MMTPESTDAGTGSYVVKSEYFYPNHGITIQASSQQEADELLAKKLADATIKETDHE